MTLRNLPGTAAWENAAAKAGTAHWAKITPRFATDLVEVRHEPKFALGARDRFFCIGSCFARNIEEHLIYRGVDVLSRKIVSPKAEWRGRPNGIVNKFTTASMRNELDWASQRPEIDERLFERRPEGWSDLQLCGGVRPATLERAIARRSYLIDDYFARIKAASVVVLTLGLNEVWFDRTAGRHLNAPPSFYACRSDPSRYELRIADVGETVKELHEIRRLVLTLSPDAKLIVTVSPVPMATTFSGRDVGSANLYSKSTLLAAATAFAGACDDVDYFPSYDMITLTERAKAFAADHAHVRDAVVGQVMQTFLRIYMGLETAPPAFNEISYLAANADVDDAVRRAEYDSGFAHWRDVGRVEGRPLTPENGPTRFMIAAGVA